MSYKILFVVFFTILLLFNISSIYADSKMVNGNNIEYSIKNGMVLDIVIDPTFNSLIIRVDANDDGQIQISIPRILLDAKIEDVDDEFFVLNDGEVSDFDETKTLTSRTLTVNFFDGTEEVEIIGTKSKQIQDKSTEIFEEQAHLTKTEQDESGGCLIATAAYGTEMAPQVQFLREIRDNTIMSTSSGAAFMTGFNQLYYSFSPTIADMERESPLFREAVRIFITPMVSTLSIMTLAEEGSELEVLGLGISVIALNLGMYVAAPVAIGFTSHRYIKSRL